MSTRMETACWSLHYSKACVYAIPEHTLVLWRFTRDHTHVFASSFFMSDWTHVWLWICARAMSVSVRFTAAALQCVLMWCPVWLGACSNDWGLDLLHTSLRSIVQVLSAASVHMCCQEEQPEAQTIWSCQMSQLTLDTQVRNWAWPCSNSTMEKHLSEYCVSQAIISMSFN